MTFTQSTNESNDTWSNGLHLDSIEDSEVALSFVAFSVCEKISNKLKSIIIWKLLKLIKLNEKRI